MVDMSDSSPCPHLLPGDDRANSTGIPSVEPKTTMTLKSKMFLSDHQSANLDRDVSLEHEHPGPSQTKEEKEEIWISPEGEQLALKQEPDVFLMVPTSEGCDRLHLSHNSDENEKEGQKETSVDDGTEAEIKEGLHKNETYSCSIAHSSNFLVFHTYSLPFLESFECQMCGKNFRSESKLYEHMIFHTDLKPFSCDTCGKRFKNSSSLSVHGRLHTGEKPYPCKTCGKCFTRSHTLMVHMRRHMGEKSYLCKICGKNFPFTSILKVNKRIRTDDKPFLRHICGKRFCQKTGLIHHTRVHTDERPYPCKTCSLSFKHSNTLKIHMKRHR